MDGFGERGMLLQNMDNALSFNKELSKDNGAQASLFGLLTDKSTAPDFKLKDLDQITVELASFKNKEPVVVFFWTTWCPYCQKALKGIAQKISDLKKEGVEVLPITMAVCAVQP